MNFVLPSSFSTGFFWCLAVIFSLIGMGRLAGRLVDAEASESAGWGLHSIWGMVAYLFVSSFLAVFGWCNATTITILIGAGLVALLWMNIRSWRQTLADLKSSPWQLWPAFAVAA